MVPSFNDTGWSTACFTFKLIVETSCRHSLRSSLLMSLSAGNASRILKPVSKKLILKNEKNRMHSPHTAPDQREGRLEI